MGDEARRSAEARGGAGADGRAELRPAVFIDRDGTLIQEREYLSDPEGVSLVPGVPRALKDLRAAGYALVVVTNQSGIARGLYTEEEYRAVAERIDRELADAGTGVDATYYCPHHPEASGPCACRKPGTEMHRRAARDLGLVVERSWYVGDKVKDVLPARSLGGEGILVRTGFGAEQEERLPPEFRVAENFPDAARTILAETTPDGAAAGGAPRGTP